jgi:RNA polymerase sigma-70 factor (family 1)
VRKPLLNISHFNFNSFQAGKERAFEDLFKIYYKSLCFFAYRYVKDMSIAEDIVSEEFVQLWVIREKIKSESHLRNWLYRAVYHLCLDQLNKTKTKDRHIKALGTLSVQEEKDCTVSIIKAETMRQLKLAIDLLPGQCKKVFYKIYLEGKTVKETAQELRLAISTINNQKARGVKLLRTRLREYLSAIFVLLFLYQA